MSSFTLYPAIDVRHGRIVRLAQGDYAQETRYGDDPLALAGAYAAQGARWLHLVDLDAARAGGFTLGALVGRIVADTGLQVQTGGGVRSRDDVQRILDAGASRVVIGSLAVREADTVAGWIDAFGSERITVALDTRQDREGTWRLPVHGWTETAAGTLQDMARRYAAHGLRHLLCTDISRDGMLTGPNLDLYRLLVAEVPGVELQASGGVRDLADVLAARELGCAGIVLGRSLLEGRLELPEALDRVA
ncbi:1-(5-phosphoribosyl)-5-[(5-phosphoribosylamino)methylideneamino] imidazole-4-carboxamide isomerase [Luteimonas sp. J16]|jgi:phosphoribosylformimino-5-aminoimidazole carboxamide ribotide isomerase|uniref:1-(5-phosphoribosyl)-5-[(5- phosphoribosylamino)methylideneamino]imidazole-4- carboxamide isomerase n=1 Tax=unclassified Luteimonas TaxID=2629088 RepID=UPI00047E273C|nr:MULTISPECIES: 1-(5-phosphoribosyl)-5-[(5-phosphoribosylamino)methylideneamino]imidazole-4-carboxamide isomerase [unclassified Luteimonas]TWG91465.1 1-(5-phosphoribosyl)-5-[(5-phosphoribosylamino)methylideneamino] imidazole-4-carboxamide isomerase [Luteimonas sp. J16]